MATSSYLTIVFYTLYLTHGTSSELSDSPFGENVQHYDPGCFGESRPMTVTPSAVNQRYFDLFSSPPRQPNGGQTGGGPPPPQDADLYRCLDAKLAPYFDRITSKVGRNQMFSSFDPKTQEAVADLQDLIEDNIIPADNLRIVRFLEYLKYRGDIHPQLLMHAIAGAEISKPETKLVFLPTPALAEIFPTKFFSGSFQPELGQRRGVGDSSTGKCVLVNDKWGKTNGIENRLWYFREDVGLNMHHWSWHLHNPFQSDKPINRRGELFYFFHHDLLARYAAQRIANGFEDYFVTPIHPYNGMEIPQGYDSNLKDGVSRLDWINRPNKTIMKYETLPPKRAYDLKLHQSWWDRVANITNNNGDVNSNTGDIHLIPDGINSFGELFEGSVWSLNKDYYGYMGWHNMAHVLMGSLIIHKDQGHSIGVLGDVAVAMRDIVFYRIHQSVNEMFINYKKTILKPYQLSEGTHPLILPGIVGKEISIQAFPPNTTQAPLPPSNQLKTFWKNRNMILDGGLDFNYTGGDDLNLAVCVKHLDHGDFVYNIILENTLSTPQNVYIRIFMAPRFKVNGQRFTIGEQFLMFFVQDAFPYTSKPGTNFIQRHSIESTVSTPWWKTKAELQTQLTSSIPDPGECTCGYPQHLMVPKGTEAGSVYDLVAMVTDGADFNLPPGAKCAKAFVHCGLPGNDYPDKKPMGYPFDRIVPGWISDDKMLEDYVAQIPNMVLSQVTVHHDDTEVKEHV